MTMDHAEILTRIRAAGRTFQERARSDPAFREAFHNDPAGTLQSVGMPEEAIAEVFRESGFGEDEVVGFAEAAPTRPIHGNASSMLGIQNALRMGLGLGSLAACSGTCNETCAVTGCGKTGSSGLLQGGLR